jgi:hypothetical protein
MLLRNTIKKILKEETELPKEVKRRLSTLDDIFHDKIKNYVKPELVSRYDTDEQILGDLINSALDTIYNESFSHFNIFSRDWERIWTFLHNYLKEKYQGKIKFKQPNKK